MEFIFSKMDPLAIFVFIFATMAVTQGLKYVLSKSLKFCALMEVGFFVILLSWVIGAIVFFALFVVAAVVAGLVKLGGIVLVILVPVLAYAAWTIKQKVM